MLYLADSTPQGWPLLIMQSENLDEWNQLTDLHKRLQSAAAGHPRNVNGAMIGTLDELQRQFVIQTFIKFL